MPLNFEHDGPDGERLALAWHWLWLAASGLSLIAALGGTAWHVYGVRQHARRLEQMGVSR